MKLQQKYTSTMCQMLWYSTIRSGALGYMKEVPSHTLLWLAGFGKKLAVNGRALE
jgi:hypothetical protein